MSQTIELRAFGDLLFLFKERGWQYPLQRECTVPMSGFELLRLLNIPEEKLESIFINGKAHGLEEIISPGDRVALVPPGTPGPHRYLLGIKKL